MTNMELVLNMLAETSSTEISKVKIVKDLKRQKIQLKKEEILLKLQKSNQRKKQVRKLYLIKMLKKLES